MNNRLRFKMVTRQRHSSFVIRFCLTFSMVTVKIPNRFLHQLWLNKQAKHLFDSEDRLRTQVEGGKNPGIISAGGDVMSEEEQQRQTAAAADLLSMNGQSHIYTATEDTLFTQTAPILSKTHSLVSTVH